MSDHDGLPLSFAALDRQGQYEHLIEQWQSVDCGEFPLRIDRDGLWWTAPALGQAFTPLRHARIEGLLHQLLWCEPADYSPQTHSPPKYFLKSPVEKLAITVQDLPYYIVDWNWRTDTDSPAMLCQTRQGEQVTISEQHPLVLSKQSSLPCVRIRRNLWAKFSRNAYYRLIEHLLSNSNSERLEFESQGSIYQLNKDFANATS